MYGGDDGRYPVSDQNFNCNGLIAPDRRWNPHAYEVQYFYQNIWATPVDMNKGQIEIYNENFYTDLSAYRMEYYLTVNGVEAQGSRGEFKLPKIAAQQRVKVTVPGIAKAIKNAPKSSEILVCVEFKLKEATPLLEKDFTVARNQFQVTEYSFPVISAETVADTKTAGEDVKIDEAVAYVKLEAAGVVYTFNKNSGWIDYIDVDGKQVTQNGSQLKSDFWRAPTDNDYGASLQRRMQAWQNPSLRRTAFECKVEDGLGKVNVKYEIEQLYASLEIQYVLTRTGELHVTQKMVTRPDEAAQANAQAAPQRQGQRGGQRGQGGMPDLFKFGMTMQMAREYDRVEYCGRGPVENYSDRNSAQFLGIYQSTVADQYFPYIRPQENGNKTDVRWWKVVNADGKGLKFYSDAPLSMSSLNYTTDDLDEGMNKHNVHAGDLDPRPFTVVHIDKVQYGLACVNSWGATPLEPYKLHYGDYSYSFVIEPVR